MTLYPESNLLLLAAGGALALFSLAAGAAHIVVRDSRRRAAVANLVVRVKSWWVMTAFLAAAFLAGNSAVILLFAFVSLACLREFMTITQTGRADRAALLAAFYLVLPAQYWFIWKGWYWPFALAIPVCVFFVLPVLAALTSETQDFLARIAELQWGIMSCVYCVSYVPALLMLSNTRWFMDGFNGGASVRSSGLLAIFLIIVAQSSDIMQYVFGKLFGRHSVAPAISPSKTVEGLAGGLVSATALGAALWWITPFPQWQAGAIAFLIAVMGFFGGVVMSAIKRDRGIKDWGRLVPGHGGMLDRLDSVCFAAPVFFYLAHWLTGGPPLGAISH